MMTERDVLRLCPGSTLEKMFSGMHELKKIDDEVFLDRDGKTFQYLVNYLRNDREVLPEFMDRNDEIHFFKELDFCEYECEQHWDALRHGADNNKEGSYAAAHSGLLSVMTLYRRLADTGPMDANSPKLALVDTDDQTRASFFVVEVYTKHFLQWIEHGESASAE